MEKYLRNKYAYLRLSITDNCNLNCLYCRPDKSTQSCKDHSLSLEELYHLTSRLNETTPLDKIRITGGEPLVRKGVSTLVENLRRLLPDAELNLTTNAVLLEKHAVNLKEAGLDRINISIDSLDAGAFYKITGSKRIEAVRKGIIAAQKAGFDELKLNTVLMKGLNDHQIIPLIKFASGIGCQIRFIELMPLGKNPEFFKKHFFSAGKALNLIKNNYELEELPERKVTAKEFSLSSEGKLTKLGLITSVSQPFCGNCNRLRLDSQGKLYTCLRKSNNLDLGSLSDEKFTDSVNQFLGMKTLPEKNWGKNRMYAIGG